MTIIFNWLAKNYIEIVATVLGIVGVWFSTKQNIWFWPLGLINVILSLYVFFATKLYADVVLQVFYLVMTIYGWYNWLYGGTNKTELKVSRIKQRTLIILILISTDTIIIAGYLFSTYTDAALPYWDSTIAIWGIITTYMEAKKYIENWLFWINTDLLCTGIYFYKGLYAFTALYFVFVILAIYGYIEWKKDLKKIEQTVL